LDSKKKYDDECKNCSDDCTYVHRYDLFILLYQKIKKLKLSEFKLIGRRYYLEGFF
jgi:hypothetical protein